MGEVDNAVKNESAADHSTDDECEGDVLKSWDATCLLYTLLNIDEFLDALALFPSLDFSLAY